MASMSVPLCGAESYFRNFPTTFCNYEEKLCIGDTHERSRFYIVIAEKVALLYANALRQVLRERSELFDKTILNEERIEIFYKTLRDYIVEQLSTDKMVDLVANKTQQSQLKSMLDKCGIDLEAPAGHNIFFLPRKSRIFLSPHVQEEYGYQDGLSIFMENIITGIKIE